MSCLKGESGFGYTAAVEASAIIPEHLHETLQSLKNPFQSAVLHKQWLPELFAVCTLCVLWVAPYWRVLGAFLL